MNYKILPLLLVFVLTALQVLAQSEEGCTTTSCHGDLILKQNIHPAMEDDCYSCHDGDETNHPMGQGTEFALVDESPALCYTCHDEFDGVELNLHAPVEIGECTSCHSAHSSNSDLLLVKATVKSTCAQCHDISQQKGNFHAPVEDGLCTDCHNPHQSKFSVLLNEETPELCFSCHSDLEPDETVTSVHSPFEEDCGNCHDPHVNENRKLLVENTPNLCITCHDNPSEGENIISVHGALSQSKTCVNCHNPHSSMNSALLVKEEINTCLSCHSTEIRLEDRNISDIAQKIENEELAHPPVIEDGCNTCHKPHASEFAFLLNESFPSGNYAAGFEVSYILCFTCHDETAFTVELTNEDTEFRNGSTNLHFVHVNKDKSRSCTNCHDVHGSKKEHLITE